MIEGRPFLKWAGNKYQILRQIKAVLPPGERLIEPFVGSGAVFLNTDYKEYLLADSNKDLIDLFLTLQNEGEAFIDYCWSFFIVSNNSEERYYQLRDDFNSTTDVRRKAALFVYLNRHGYNGLCRYNAKGVFNTPFGRYRKPRVPEEGMRHFLARAGRAVFQVADFRDTMRAARRGDVLYCDPPYVPLSATAHFTSYSPGGFGGKEQTELAELAQDLADRGVPVLVSNHDTEFTANAYRAARIERLDVQRFISCNGDNRSKAKEVLALFGEECSIKWLSS